MQNVIYAVIGVILTVAAMYMVAPSINSSSESIKANLVATEVGAIKNSAKMWLANESTDGTYASVTGASVSTYLPELDYNTSNSKFTSKAGNGVTIAISPVQVTNANDAIQIDVDELSAKQATIIVNSVQKLTSQAVTTAAATSGGTNKKVTIKIKG